MDSIRTHADASTDDVLSRLMEALAQSLDFDPAFKAAIVRDRAGSNRLADVMPSEIGDAGHASMKVELQRRADKGFVDATGYARTAARETVPLRREAVAKLREAATAGDPDHAKALRTEASALVLEARTAEAKYLAPLVQRARADAAYGLGVRQAMFLARRAEVSPADRATSA